jgi:hypothetical protein
MAPPGSKAASQEARWVWTATVTSLFRRASRPDRGSCLRLVVRLAAMMPRHEPARHDRPLCVQADEAPRRAPALDPPQARAAPGVNRQVEAVAEPEPSPACRGGQARQRSTSGHLEHATVEPSTRAGLKHSLGSADLAAELAATERQLAATAKQLGAWARHAQRLAAEGRDANRAEALVLALQRSLARLHQRRARLQQGLGLW